MLFIRSSRRDIPGAGRNFSSPPSPPPAVPSLGHDFELDFFPSPRSSLSRSTRGQSTPPLLLRRRRRFEPEKETWYLAVTDLTAQPLARSLAHLFFGDEE